MAVPGHTTSKTGEWLEEQSGLLAGKVGNGASYVVGLKVCVYRFFTSILRF
jgi:hypothetical protein